ncbi:SDR family NAD(P)-dependent oxidoreductase [Chondromyces crocatus]|nr:SDR family NAD(P)-dependent oxidoreductase [Chondromyces crocatus]
MRGKVVLITGASSGIGAALAREVVQRGARPVLVARRSERLEELSRELENAGGKSLPVTCDIRKEGEIERAVGAAREVFGGIDVVVANAGFGVLGRVEALTLDDVQRQFETNVLGMMRTIQATLGDVRQSRGCLALVGSMSAYMPLPGFAAYNMSKAAVKALADTLRLELLRDGVAVLHVVPGLVHSELPKVDNHGVFDESRVDPVVRLRVPAQEAAREIVDAIAARRDEAVITRHGRVLAAMARYAPGLTGAALGMAAKRG